MVLSSINFVRSQIGDMNKVAVSESVTENADGTSSQFQLDMFPMRTGTLTCWVSGVVHLSATAVETLGVLDFTNATNVPTAAAQVVVTYQYNALSDDEIQEYINQASGGGLFMAASFAALGLAGNFSRYFAYTQGNKMIDKDRLGDKLMRLSKELAARAETNLAIGTATITITTFDDSGTPFEGYDTAIAASITATA